MKWDLEALGDFSVGVEVEEFCELGLDGVLLSRGFRSDVGVSVVLKLFYLAG